MQFQAPPGVRPLFAIGLGNLAVLALGLLSSVVSARALGPLLRGEYVAAQTFAGVAAVLLTLGVTQAVVTYRGDYKKLVSALLLQAGSALVLGTALFVTLSITGAQPWLGEAGVIGGATLTASSLIVANSSGLAQRRGHMAGEFQSVRLVPQLVGVLSLMVLWILRVRSPSLWLLTVGIVNLLSSSVMMLHLLGGRGALATLVLRLPPRQLVRGASSAFVTVIGAQLIYRLDSLLVAIWLPSASVGLYAVATSAGGACAAVGQAVGMLTFSRLREVKDSTRQRALIRRSTLLALGVSSAASIPLIIVAPTVIRLVYGSAFGPAESSTRVLALAAIPLSADYLLIHALLSLGAARSVFRVQVFAAALTIGLLIIVIPSGHLAPIALVSLGVYTASAAALFAAAMRRTRAVAAVEGLDTPLGVKPRSDERS